MQGLMTTYFILVAFTIFWIILIPRTFLVERCHNCKNRTVEIRSKEKLVNIHPEIATKMHMVNKSFKEQPLYDIYYNTNGTNSDRSVYVVPRRAYFDRRLVAGKPRNKVLIICEILNTELDTISACELNGKFSESVHVIYEESLTKWTKTFKAGLGYTHRIAVVECPYLPELVTNGSITKIIYKKPGDSFYSRVETEKPLLLTKLGTNPSKPTQGAGSIIACTEVFNQPGRLQDWLIYQRTIGMDAVHIDADISFYDNISFAKTYPFLDEMIHKGFVQIDYWNNIVSERMWDYGQIMKYNNCLYRYMGVYDFGMFSDVDDFFNPMDPHHKDIHYYFNKMFSRSKIANVCLFWRTFYCKPLEHLRKTLLDGNLTSILSGHGTEWRRQRKCAHRLSGAMLVATHGMNHDLPGYHHTTAQKEFAYIAHIRISRVKFC